LLEHARLRDEESDELPSLAKFAGRDPRVLDPDEESAFERAFPESTATLAVAEQETQPKIRLSRGDETATISEPGPEDLDVEMEEDAALSGHSGHRTSSRVPTLGAHGKTVPRTSPTRETAPTVGAAVEEDDKN
jgi:hypothetical protein